MAQASRTTSRTRRALITSIGAALLLLAVAVVTSTIIKPPPHPGAERLDDGSHLLGEAAITPDLAIDVALTDTSGPVEEVDLERAGEELIYDIEINGSPVYVDAASGTLVYVEFDNDEDIASRPKVAFDDADPQELNAQHGQIEPATENQPAQDTP